MKASKEYFHVVLPIILYKMVLTFKVVNIPLTCDHSNESYWACGIVYYAVLREFLGDIFSELWALCTVFCKSYLILLKKQQFVLDVNGGMCYQLPINVPYAPGARSWRRCRRFGGQPLFVIFSHTSLFDTVSLVLKIALFSKGSEIEFADTMNFHKVKVKLWKWGERKWWEQVNTLIRVIRHAFFTLIVGRTPVR